MKKYSYYVGIDTGTKTGYASWDKENGFLKFIGTLKIHEAMMMLNDLDEEEKKVVFVRVEDARKRKWFGNAGREQLQGAGSIKRDAKIWEDFLTDLGIDFELVPPKNNKTKLSSESFKKITGWLGKTTEHSRDAAMLVFGL